ncbi:MAG: glycine betaine ABC transporter substrate-binding protein [Planctomycetota bacterium]|jgi:osmoprotectant transport system permease protein
MLSGRHLFCLIACLLSLVAVTPDAPAQALDRPIRVGSKNFTENYILAEIMAQLLESRGYQVERVHGLGGTMVCFSALENGEIDVYPEYTGTIQKEILSAEAGRRSADISELRREISKRFNLEILAPLGFNNSYAIAMKRDKAGSLNISRISDLARHSGLRGGMSYEFLQRDDGWQRLREFYGLSNAVRGMEHGLAHEALQQGRIDFTDIYTTDAKNMRFDVQLLKDDRSFFPVYSAVPFASPGLPHEVKSLLNSLADILDEKTMIRLNASVELDKVDFTLVAREFLAEEKLVDAGRAVQGENRLYRATLRRTAEHLFMTFTALAGAVIIALPLGVRAYRSERWSNILIPLTGLLQTIPSLALLAFMIPLFGIGMTPAIIALFLYSLLPIVRNTYVGLCGIDPSCIESARAMGMDDRQRLWHVELPLAYPTILAGVKTAAIINIGTATLAAFIGAGGLGEPIIAGLALHDHRMILEGAIPAAILALLVELFFRLFDAKQ